MTSLRIFESQNIIRVTWVGVQGATAYKVSWSPESGMRSNLLHIVLTLQNHSSFIGGKTIGCP